MAAWRRDDRATVALVALFGLGFRLLALGGGPDLSSDLRRYLWDGRVQAAGFSPWAMPPSDPRLAALVDAEAGPATINRPGAVTVYPPGAQAWFRLLHDVGVRTTGGLRRVAVGADLATLALLLALLARLGVPRGRLALWAWSPLAIAETAVSAHLEALLVPLVLGALLVGETAADDPRASRRTIAAGGLLGAASLIKLWPALLLAALPPARRRLAAATAGGLFLVAYLAWLPRAGAGVLGFLPRYFRSGEDFNLALRGFLAQALASPLGRAARPTAMALCAVALLAAIAVIARRRDATSTVIPARDLLIAFVLLFPGPLHPWYALALVPLVAAAPSAAGMWLCATLPLSYLKYGAPDGVMPPWIPAFEFLPACALLLAGAMRARFFRRGAA